MGLPSLPSHLARLATAPFAPVASYRAASRFALLSVLVGSFFAVAGVLYWSYEGGISDGRVDEAVEFLIVDGVTGAR